MSRGTPPPRKSLWRKRRWWWGGEWWWDEPILWFNREGPARARAEKLYYNIVFLIYARVPPLQQSAPTPGNIYYTRRQGRRRVRWRRMCGTSKNNTLRRTDKKKKIVTRRRRRRRCERGAHAPGISPSSPGSLYLYKEERIKTRGWRNIAVTLHENAIPRRPTPDARQ